MKRLLGIAFTGLLVGCGNTAPPKITAAMAGAYPQANIRVAELDRGRILFASRCIECHTLPPLASHTNSEWSHLVDTMARRASLKPAEREAVLAYILAARAQENSGGE